MDTELTPPKIGEPPLRTSLRLVWLVGLVYVVASATKPGESGRHLAALVLTATTAVGWAGWLGSRYWDRLRISVASIAVLAASGGAVTVLSPFGVVVVAVAAMCAGGLLELAPASGLAAIGVAAAAIGVAATGHDAVAIANAASGAVAGLVIGLGRRQQQQRVQQAAELTIAQERTELERERAEVLSERNRIAREVHDVLAHTLGALSVQMEALDSLVEGSTDPAVRAAVHQSRRLVLEGLDETRRAVRVLRDEPVAVDEQIGGLAEQAGATFDQYGDPRPLAPAAGLALVRVAQEALTNARRHAPGAAVTVTLRFGPSQVGLVVADSGAVTPPALAATSAGYGLRGMRERVELLGGTFAAGPGVAGSDTAGWEVRAEIPA